MIYLDYNATTPCDPRVVETMLPYFGEKFGNAASRTHPFGWIADEGVEQARRQVADMIGAAPQEIVFTSGATESCNLAIKGVWEMYASKGKHMITCATEHKAVLDTCGHLQRKGAEITVLGAGTDGLIDLEALEAAIKPSTVLIAIMYANNETGVIQPVAEIGRIAEKHKVFFFTDATQAAGKIPVDVQQDPIHLMALSGHKFYGPKGAGALYIRRRDPRVRLLPQMDGGGHERGFRSGTLNVPGIVGMGKAAAICTAEMADEASRLRRLRDQLETALLGVTGTKVNGHREQRLAHVSNLSFAGLKAERMVAALNSRIAFSVGSACTSAQKAPSHVLEAMGLSEEQLAGSIRWSLGRFTTAEEIATAINDITRTIGQLRP